MEALEGIQDIEIKSALEIISKIFSVPVDSIRLTDEFGKDLGRALWGSMFESMAVEDFYLYIQSQKDQYKIEYPEKILNVLDFIKFQKYLNDNSKPEDPLSN